MDFTVTTLGGEDAGKITLSDAIFGLEPREDLIARIVRWQLAKRQQGTHKALGRSEELAYASIRFSLGRKTTEAEIDFVIEKITGVIQMLRARHGAALAQAT